MKRKLLQGAVLVAIAASIPTAWADGVKGVQINNVAAGTAAISRAGNTMTIRTGTPRTIINYQRLSVASGETLQFLQPSAKSRVLNRIQGAEPTVIDGTIYSNGQVYFVNPAGVMFGEGSIINAGGLIAAAGHISDANFMAGVNRFTDNRGAVTNYGVIHAKDIHLVGASVANFGQILTTGSGVITMTAGKDVYIGETDGPAGSARVLVKVSSDKSAEKAGTGVTNQGTLDAGAGQISMGAGDLYAAGIYNNGELKAALITSNSGASTNINEGRIDASNANGKGGSIELVGDKVGVFGGTIDASGKTGGGSIKIGGDFHGAAGTPASSMTAVDADAVIRADALESGNGGQIAIWSDITTVFYGTVTARGGALGGNGGFVEISGKQNLAFNGFVDVSAVAGLPGSVLFDPATITIQATGSNNASLTAIFNATTGGPDFTFSASAIEALVGAVVLTAENDIDVNASLSFGSTGVTSFTLVSNTADINIAKGVKIEGTTQAITLTAGDDIFMADSGGGASASAEIKTTTGNILLQAAGSITLQASNSDAFAAKLTSAGGNITLLANDTIFLDSGNGGAALITTGGGSLTLRSGTGITMEGNNASIHVSLSSTGSGTGGPILISTGDTTLGGTAGNLALGDNILFDTGGGNLTFKLTNFAIGSANQTFVAGTGTVAFETNNDINTIGIGSGGGTLAVTNGILANILAAGTVTVGKSGSQSGVITARNAVLLLASPLEINSNSGAGAIAVDDNGGTGLSVTSNLTLRAGSGGITVTQGNNNNPDIALNLAGTTLTLVSGAGVGLSTNRLGISGSAGQVDVTAAGNVYLTSLGTNGIVFGSVSNAGSLLDIISGGDINASGTLTAAGLILNASGGIGTTTALALNISGAGTLTSKGDNAAGNIHILVTQVTAGAFTFINTGAGIQTNTIDSAGNLSLANGVVGGDSLVVNASGSLFAAGATISGSAVTLHAGTTGTGNLDVTGASLIADSIALIAGNGSGSGAILATGALFTGATADLPGTITIEQDAGLADIPSVGTGSALTVTSHAGTVGIFSNHDLLSLSATGTTLVLSGNASVATFMSLNGPLSLSGNSQLVGPTLTITGLIGSQGGNFGLTTNATVQTTFEKGVTSTPGAELSFLTVQPAGGIVTIGDGTLAGIRTTGNVSIGDALRLNGTVTITSTSGGTIRFRNTVDSAGSPHSPLIVSTSGTTIFDGDVGSITPLGGVTVLGGGNVTLGNATSSSFTLSVGSPVLFSGNVSLAVNTTITATGGTTGTVTFQGTVFSAVAAGSSLTVNASDAVTFEKDIGDGATHYLSGLTVTLTSVGPQIYFGTPGGPQVTAYVDGPLILDGPVTALADTDLLSLANTEIRGLISSGTGSHSALLVRGDTGILLSRGTSTGSASLLASLITDTNGGGVTQIGNGGGAVIIKTLGFQTHQDQVTLADDTTFQTTTDGAALTFQDPATSLAAGGFNLTLIGNAMAFGGSVTGTAAVTLQPLSPANNVSIQAASAVIANTLVLTATDISNFTGFASMTIGYPDGSGTVTLNGSPVFAANTLIQSPSGGTVAVASTIFGLGQLKLHAGTIGLGGSVVTVGTSLTLQGAVNVTATGVSLQSHFLGAAGNITVIGTIDGAQALTINADGSGGDGIVDLQGEIGGTTPLTSLSVSGGTLILHNNIRTTGSISLTSAQTLLDTGTGGTSTFSLLSGGGLVNITTLDPTGAGTANLIISTSAGGVAGAITLGNIGGLTPLSNLTLVTTGATNGLTTLNGGVHVTGTVSLTGGGMTEAASGTIEAAALVLQGSGTYSLNNANQVGILAADVTGSLNFGSITDVVVGTIGLVAGINTGGSALTLNASGHAVTVSAPIFAGLTSITAGTITIDTGIVGTGALTTTGNTVFNASASATSIHVVGATTLNANLTATTGSVQLDGAATLAGNISAATSVTLGNLVTDLIIFSGSHTVTAGGLILVKGASEFSGAGSTTLSAAGASGITFNGSAAASHPVHMLASAGSIVFNAPLAFTGSGTSTLTAALGITILDSVASSQSLLLNASGGVIYLASTLHLTGSGQSAFTAGSAGMEIDGNINSSQTLALTATAGEILLLGSVTLTGSGTSTLTAANANGISIAGDLASSQVLVLSATGGTIGIGGAVSLTGSGTSTLTAAGANGISVTGNINSSQVLALSATAGRILLSGSLTLTGSGTSTLTSASLAGITIAGDLTSSQVLVLSATGGSIGIGGALALTGTGTTTLTAAGTTGIAVTGNIISAQRLALSATTGGIVLGSLTLTGPGTSTLTAAGTTGIAIAGDVTSSQVLVLSATGGSIGIGGAVALTGAGTTTLTAAGTTGISVTGNIISAHVLALSATNGRILLGSITLTGSGTSTLTAAGAGGITIVGDLNSSQVLALSATSGSIGIGGAIGLSGSGTSTMTAAGVGGIVVGGDFVSSHALTLLASSGSISLGGDLAFGGTGTSLFTANGAGGISVAGTITGSHALTFITNDTAAQIALGQIGNSSDGRYTGTITIAARSANNVNGVVLNGNVFVNAIIFDGSHASVPTVATIVSPGNLTIDAASLIDMRANEKITVLGNLVMRSHASSSQVGMFLGDIGALGTVVIDAGGAGPLGLGRINIRLRTPQSELGANGSPLSADGGTDIVSYSPTPVSALDAGFGAGATTVAIRGNVSIIGVPGPVNIASVKIQVVSATANIDIAKSGDGDPNAILLFPSDQGGVLTTNHGVPILPRIIDTGSNLSSQAGDISDINKTLAAITAPDLTITSGPLTGTIRDLVPTGTTGDSPTPSAQAAIIPQDVQTLFPERGEAISGALAEALQQLGIYARPLDADELVDELLGRGLYNDTLRVLTPVDSSHTVAVNRLPSVPVLPVVEAARALMYREERDESGNTKLVSKTDEIATAIGVAWQACVDEGAGKNPPVEPKPAEFRAWLEQHEKDDSKFATALVYLNQIRDLLGQIKLLGLTPTEFDVSRRVILNKMRDKDRIDERDFAVMVDGPSSRGPGKLAAETPASPPPATKAP